MTGHYGLLECSTPDRLLKIKSRSFPLTMLYRLSIMGT